jgi:hypothetical protein
MPLAASELRFHSYTLYVADGKQTVQGAVVKGCDMRSIELLMDVGPDVIGCITKG